jgi:transcriptional regulator with XRE-family HTH domain
MTLSDIRKEKRITTVDLAAKLGISQGYYSNLERGKRLFNDNLLKRTAKLLGVPLNTLRDASQSQPPDLYRLKSWMSNIRIHGLPLIKAFQYFLETNGIDPQAIDDVKLKRIMKEFVEANIGFSVLAELSENKALINHIREVININANLKKSNFSNKRSKNLPTVPL